MGSRERVEAAFLHKEPDRTPIFEYILLSPVAESFLGKRYVDFCGQWSMWLALAKEQGYEKSMRQYARERVELAEVLGHDLLYCMLSPTAKEVEQAGQPEKEVPYCEDPVEAVRLRNRSHQTLVREQLDDQRYLGYVYIREEMENRGIDLPIYAPAFTHGVWSDTDLMQTMLLDPGTASEHFSLMTIQALNIIKGYEELGIDIIGIGGDFAGNRPIISPQAYREFIMPEIRTLADTIHKLGRYACNASDGNLWDVLDDFLIGTGVDAYGEVDQGAGMDLARLKKEYGDRIVFVGNMDCGQVLSYESPEAIAKMTIRCLEDGWGGGGHLFTASNAITASVPLPNYLSMLNAYKDFFGLARLKLI